MDDRLSVNESSDETEPSSENSDQALQVQSEEYGESSPTLDSPMSADAFENQQLPSDISAEESPPTVPIAVPSPPVLESFVDTFQSLVKSSRPDLYPSDVSDVNIIRSDPSLLKDGRNTDSPTLPQHSPNRLTKSPHGFEAGFWPISSLEGLIVDDGSELGSTNRSTSESDYDESDTEDESPASMSPPSAAEESLKQSPMIGETQTNRNAVQDSEELEPSTSTSEADTEQHSQSNLQDGNVGPIVEECELTNEGEASTLSRYVLTAGTLLLEIVQKLMSRYEIKPHLQEFHDLVKFLLQNPSIEGDGWLQVMLVYYDYQLNLDPREEILNFGNLECILLRIALESLIFTTLRLSVNFEAIMANYRAFKKVYEICCDILKDITADNTQGEDSSERNKWINIHLLRMKVAFQFLLMHIGKHADLKSKQKYVKQLFGDDVKYLRRSL